MIEKANTSVDYEWQAIQIAKEITIAKLNTSAPNRTDADMGEDIGKMFLAIHKEVSSVFNSSDK